MSRVRMSHATHMNESCHTHERVLSHRPRASTGWQRLTVCLKLQVIFHKRATNYKALLRKMTYKDKAYYDSTPPCNNDGNLVIHVSICKWVISHIWKMTYKDKAYYDSTPPCNNDGNLVIHVSICKWVISHIWKMTYKDKAYYDSTPPCNNEGNPVIRVSICKWVMSHMCHKASLNPTKETLHHKLYSLHIKGPLMSTH